MNKVGEVKLLRWHAPAKTLAALLFAFLPQNLFAQPSADNQSIDSVTVTAPKAAGVKPTPFLIGGSRWLSPLCLITIGLVPEENKHVTERVQQVAELVGAPIRTVDTCLPNAEVVFSTKPQEFLDAVAEKRYRLLGNINHSQANETAKVRYPIQSWYTNYLMDARGGLSLMPSAGDKWPSDDDAECIPYCFFYVDISRGGRVIIGSVIIVVDINKVQGHKIETLSDYVALMALCQARAFTKCQALPSIVNLMAEDCADEMRTDGLTPGDIAWLRGLYHMSPEAAQEADKKGLAVDLPSPDAIRGD